MNAKLRRKWVDVDAMGLIIMRVGNFIGLLILSCSECVNAFERRGPKGFAVQPTVS